MKTLKSRLANLEKQAGAGADSRCPVCGHGSEPPFLYRILDPGQAPKSLTTARAVGNGASLD